MMFDPYPRRFRNEQDALLFMEHLESGKPFPPEKHVEPFEIIDGKSVMRQEYKDAPYELGFLANEYSRHMEKVLR